MVTEVSILIPVYNQDVTALVQMLADQCARLAVRYEILLYDDGSEEKYKLINRTLAHNADVRYVELPDNIGRAAIRNRLASDARYDYLLLLDNDCLPTSPNFIYNYLKAGHKSEVVIGGVTYASKAPDKAYRLHWKYGKLRGAKSAKGRQTEPYSGIYLCNALIRRDVFLYFPLREELKRYGHEDTVFAGELRENKIHIKHIDNPVVHLGLEKTPAMMAKAGDAVANLVQLYHKGEGVEHLKLVRMFEVLGNLRLLNAYTLVFSKVEKSVLQNLYSGNPNLLLFDLYRLYLFGKKASEVPAYSVTYA